MKRIFLLLQFSHRNVPCYSSLIQSLLTMKKYFFLLLFFCFYFSKGFSQNTIYHIKVDSIAGSTKIDFARFAGKKILIVNIATRSTDTSQLRELAQLQAQQTNLVIVVLPSNSFSNEPYSNQQIARYFRLIFPANFKVAAKGEVSGNNMDNLYKWLTKKQNNDLADSRVRDDFQKYLINEQGKLIGVYDKRIGPMSTAIINAVNL